jgi:hypothetical protein
MSLWRYSVPKTGVTVYDLLISCPGDIKEELVVINDVINGFNQSIGLANNIVINIKHWYTNSFPQSGDSPQSILNKQFIDDCDVVVALFWTRFGTPTDEYMSVTEEENEKMIESGKQVFLYFCDKPIAPSDMNYEQHKKVIDFREKYKERGLYCTYNSIDEFRKHLTNHISLYFIKLIGSHVDNSMVVKDNKPSILVQGGKWRCNCF